MNNKDLPTMQSITALAKGLPLQCNAQWWIVVSFVPMYKTLPKSNVFKNQLLEWERNNGFAPGGYLKII